MAGRLDGKVALITGGTSGIGQATVEFFAAEGAKVLIVGRNGKRGAELAERLGPSTRFFKADVMHEEEIAEAVAAAQRIFGRLDILFNNAGGTTEGGVTDFTRENLAYAVDLLLGSVLYGMKHAAPVMKAQGWGAIINNSSVAALRAELGGYLYSIAKAAVTHATKLAGMELGRHGVTVNSVSPGVIATPIFFGGSQRAAKLEAGHLLASTSKMERKLNKVPPALKTGYPRDVAAAVLYLASEEGHFVNCHDLVVDAGTVATSALNIFELLK
jgi:NAD(P)-dependent dehydrogenase (short-subunit alcohol dehydrogenase family)